MIKENSQKSKCKIDLIETTDECLTGRAGLTFFIRYIQNINVYPLIERFFGTIRKSQKGMPVVEIFKQLFCFFMDGTNFHLTRFDELSRDAGYAATIETSNQKMCSSHQIKRFFNGFSFVRIYLYRRLLQSLFIWRLNIDKPSEILLNADTMVMVQMARGNPSMLDTGFPSSEK